MASSPDLAIPKGSVVLITGANGLLGSNIADQFIQHGYKIRGAARNPQKASWLEQYVGKKYGKEWLELAIVEDMATPGAFDGAIKGVSAVVHTAATLSFDADPHKAITPVVNGAFNILKASYSEPSVKRFVFTSSTGASVTALPDKPGVLVTEETWNEDAVKEAWADPPYNPERANAAYGASKAQAEQTVWDFFKENRERRPDLIVNTVVPNMNFGKSLDATGQGFPSSIGLPAALWNGQVLPLHHFIPPQYFVNLRDCALLHVAAITLVHVQEQRIFAVSGRYNWDAMLEIFRKHYPERKFPDNFSGTEDLNEYEPRGKAEQLLREMGRPGWTPLEETVLENIEGLAKVEDSSS